MATNTTIAVLARNVRMLDTGLFNIAAKPSLPAVAQNDRIVLLTFPNGARMTSAHFRVPATLGAGAVVTLQRNSGGVYTSFSAASTAATAGVATGAGLLPLDFLPGDTVEVLVTGAALAPANVAAGVVEYDLICQHS